MTGSEDKATKRRSGTIQVAVTPTDPVENLEQFLMALTKNPKFDHIFEYVARRKIEDSKFFKFFLMNLIRDNREHILELIDEEFQHLEAAIPVRNIDKETARQEIQEYIRTHPKCRTSEIIENLNLNPIYAMEILKDLKEKDLIQSKPVKSN